MGLFKRMSVIFPLVALVGITQVRASFETATTFQECILALLDENQLSCEVARPYTKCAIRTTGILHILNTDQAIEEFKTGLRQGFSQAGLFCDIDVKSIVNELNAEKGGTAAVVTQAPGVTTMRPDFQTAKTFQDCLKALLGAGQLTCQEARPYTKCAIRTLGLLDRLNTNTEKEEFEIGLNEGFSQARLSCNIDIDSVVDELKAERDGITAVVTTMSSVITQKPALTFESARTFEECTAVMIDDLQFTCSEARPYTKCAIRTMGILDKLDSARARQIFEDSIHQGFRQAGLFCNVDVDAIVQELRSERNGGVAVTSNGVYLTSLTLLLFFFVKYIS